MAKLSEFGISKETKGLSQKIFEIFNKIALQQDEILEWDIDGLIFDRDFIVEQRYISNTASESELKDSVRNIAIKIEGVKNLVIDGMGNHVFFNNRCVQIECLHCENLTFKNLIFDYINPTVSEFKVVNKGKFFVDVIINKDTLYELKNGKLCFLADDNSRIVVQELDVDTQITRRMGSLSWRSHNFFNKKRAKALDDGTIRIYTLLNPFKIGNIYQINWVRRDGTGLFMDCCKDMTIQGCRFKYMHGMGVLAQMTDNINIVDTDFLPNEDSKRTNVAFADVMHFVNCKGVINVKNVKADGTRDDVINNHGVHLKVVKKENNKIQLKYCHAQTYGFNCFFEGDEIDFIDSKTLLPVGTATVVKSKMINPRIIEVEYSNIKDDSVIKVGDAVENATWTASLIVDGLETFNIPTRGILVTTRKPVVIKNSIFHKCFMPSIHISDDVRNWYESGFVRDVLIENNVFDNCVDFAISIKPENLTSNAVHKNIRILNNKFISENGKILTAKCVDKLVFEGNEIDSKTSVKINLSNVTNESVKL